jgi:hypothetical protein
MLNVTMKTMLTIGSKIVLISDFVNRYRVIVILASLWLNILVTDKMYNHFLGILVDNPLSDDAIWM